MKVGKEFTLSETGHKQCQWLFSIRRSILNGEMESHVHIIITKSLLRQQYRTKMASIYYRQTLVLIIQKFRLYIATEHLLVLSKLFSEENEVIV